MTDPILFFDGLFKSDSGEKIEDPINDYNCHGSWSPNMNVQSLASDRYQSADQSDKNDIIYAGDDKEYMKYTFRFIGSSFTSCCFRTISNDSLKIFHLEGTYLLIELVGGIFNLEMYTHTSKKYEFRIPRINRHVVHCLLYQHNPKYKVLIKFKGEVDGILTTDNNIKVTMEILIKEM